MIYLFILKNLTGNLIYLNKSFNITFHINLINLQIASRIKYIYNMMLCNFRLFNFFNSDAPYYNLICIVYFEYNLT